jgi:hypothetical protein
MMRRNLLPAGLPYGLVVRITGFHPVGPGSIPGMGIIFADLMLFSIYEIWKSIGIFYLTHMEYEESIGLAARKMKIFYC